MAEPDPAPTVEPSPELEPGPVSQEAALSELRVVEVTTVTTVQGSSGIFLSPHPQQRRPAYVERGVLSDVRAAPSVELDRVKVDTALLFDAAQPSALSFEVGLGDIKPQHYFPAVREGRWPIALGGVFESEADSWTEWGGWRAFGGVAVETAPAATLDYELVGLESPLVLSAEEGQIVVTNRSAQTIAKTLLVYSHEAGIGIRVVESLAPGMRRITATGPKEHLPSALLALAREQLEGFFSEVAGPDLGRVLAHAKSIPFLETMGLRLIYMLDEAAAPRPVVLPRGVAGQRRFVVAQAEVLAPAEEEHVVSLLRAGTLQAADLAGVLGRFSRAKLEVAAIRDKSVELQAERLLQTLDE
jgi:hypothetical protein